MSSFFQEHTILYKENIVFILHPISAFLKRSFLVTTLSDDIWKCTVLCYLEFSLVFKM